MPSDVSLDTQVRGCLRPFDRGQDVTAPVFCSKIFDRVQLSIGGPTQNICEIADGDYRIRGRCRKIGLGKGNVAEEGEEKE